MVETEEEIKAREEKEEAEKKAAEEKKEDPATQFVSSPVIEAAKAENDRKALLIEEEKKLMVRKEKLHAEQMVGGHTEAGQPTGEQKKESNADYAKKVMSGDFNGPKEA